MQGVPVSVTRGYTGPGTGSTWSYIYDAITGGVAFTIDPDGHTTSTGYDAHGNVAASSDALGRTTLATYDALHDPLKVSDPRGVTATNTYDTHGNLLTSATPLLDASGNPVMNGSNPVVATTTYTHANGSHPEDVTSKTDADAATWSYTYDGPTGYLTSVTAPSTTDNVEHPGTAQANETLYGYDTVKGWPTAALSARGQQATGATPSISYTCTPPATGCTTTAYTDATRTSGYDLWGDATVVTDPNGHTVTKHWDTDHNLDSSTDTNGNTTTYTYDAAEQQTVTSRSDGTVTKTDYNADGTVADTVDALGAVTSYGYDAQARVISVTDPLSRVTSYGYDPAGNKVTKADPSGSCPTWPISYPPTLSPSQKCTVWGYDAANEPTSITYSDGVTPNVTSIGYDADGQRTSMHNGTSTAWAWGWDSLHRLTTTTDDQNKTVTDGYADSTKTGTGQQGQELIYGPTAITYPGTPTVVANRHYDAAGRMDCLTTGSSVAECTPGATGSGQVNYTWDADANLNVSAASLPSSVTVADTTTYDKADQATGITAAKNSTNFATFTYGRDNANQINSVTSTGVPTDNHSYTYNPLEQLKTTDTTLYGYDGGDNLTSTLAGASQYYDVANELTASVAGPGIVLVGSTTAANASGATLTVNYPSGVKSGDWLVLALTMAYPNTQTLPTGWAQVVKKSSGSVSGTSDTTYVLRHKAASETSVTFTGTFARSAALSAYRGVAATNPIDVSGSASTNGGTTVTTPSVTTTAAGDRVVVATGANAATTGSWAPPATMTARAQAGTASLVTALDDQGQQTAGATGTRAATYSQSSQLVGIVVTLKAATTQPTPTTYTYDTRGNRTGVTPPTGSASSLGYDQANRLTSFAQGTTTASYTYAGDGLRMTKTVNTTTTTFTWDETSATPALLYDGAENYIYGADGAVLEQIDNSSNQLWYHHDQMATTRVLSDNTGTGVSTFTYGAYGNQTAHTGTTTSPLRYNGQYTDAETGLVYLRARYYDATTGQFVSRDPLAALTHTAYGYVNDNPLNGSDASGLSKCGDWSLGGFVDCVATASHDPIGTLEQGWNSMSTSQQVADATLPVTLPLTVAACWFACPAAAAAGGGVLANYWNEISTWLQETSRCQGEAGALGASGYEPGGEAAHFTVEELAQLVYQHVGAGDIAGRPTLDEIQAALERGAVSTLQGQNAVQLDYGGVRVIVNEDLPWRSTAYYPGS
jgi:RHS repeat-associated protein